MTPLMDHLRHLPRHPFKLARALVRNPLTAAHGPSSATDLQSWTRSFPILLIHEDAQVATGIHALLRIQQWRGLICTTAINALFVVKAVPVSLIMIGPNLPDMSQSAVIRELAVRPHSRTTPLLVLNTAETFARPLALPRNASMLMMPFDHDDLVSMVRDLLLAQGNWRWPADYSAKRAEYAIRQFVFAR